VLLYATMGWNVLTVIVSLPAAFAAGSVALAGFGLDSGVEVGASFIAIRAVRGDPGLDRGRSVTLVRLAFVAIAVYLVGQAGYVFLSGDRPDASPVGIGLLLATVIVMTTLALLKRRVGRELHNAVVTAEAKVTLIDSFDSALVLLALLANAAFGLWWADPVGGLILAAYSFHEAAENHS
jgi:divalent metal cation (Fe/Co/Zn/Cd) transporter